MTNLMLELEAVARSPSTERAVGAVRNLLEMDSAFTTQIVGGRYVLEVVRGDGASFGLAEGTSMPLGQTYCSEIMAGRLPAAIGDVRAHARAAEMPISAAANVGAFISVPLKLASGSTYGTLCAVDHDPRPELGDRELQYMRIFARMIADEIERNQLHERMTGLQAYEASIEALMIAVEARDSYTGDHSRAVVRNARSVARKLGLSPPQVADVEKVALLHDVGKLAVPDSILRKEGSLTEAEWAVMREHPAAGARIVSAIEGLSHLAPAIRAEHERWDGEGYPDGLAGEEIPLAARIAFVCDAYDAITTERPYRAPMTHEVAVAELIANAGSQFCPRSAAALIAVFAEQRGEQALDGATVA
jgi:hypothetical protein